VCENNTDYAQFETQPYKKPKKFHQLQSQWTLCINIDRSAKGYLLWKWYVAHQKIQYPLQWYSSQWADYNKVYPYWKKVYPFWKKCTLPENLSC